jgi:hypothetical protein
MSTPVDPKKDWGRPKPEKLPPPTYMPVVLAAGIVFFVWGLVFSLWFVALGVVLMVLAFAGWVRALQQDVAAGTGTGEQGREGERERGSEGAAEKRRSGEGVMADE